VLTGAALAAGFGALQPGGVSAAPRTSGPARAGTGASPRSAPPRSSRPTPASTAASHKSPTLAANRGAARRDARYLLSRLRVPPGATSVSAQPAGADGWLKAAPALTGTSAGAHAWWTVPGTPDAVLADIRSRPPVGATLLGTATAGNSRTGRMVQELDYGWPAIPGVIRSRQLAISVTTVSGGVTGVLVQAESEWTVPRPASERVPAGTHEIDITVAPPGGPVTRTLAVTDPGKIRRIVALFDAMPIAQPGTYACPLELNPRLLTFTFRAAPDGAALAQATYTAFGSNPGSGLCSPIQFTIAGRRQDPLIGGAFVTQVQRMLGVTLVKGGTTGP
jgi:hypothetical protein